jgi:hypothetical protein
VTTILLTAIANKLVKNKHEFSVTDHSHAEWDNLCSFLDTCRKFVFISRHWKTSKRAPAKATSMSARHQTVESLERDRKHLRNEASFDRPGLSLNQRRMMRGQAATSTQSSRRYADDEPATSATTPTTNVQAPTTGPARDAPKDSEPRPSVIDHMALLLAPQQTLLSQDHDAWVYLIHRLLPISSRCVWSFS